MNIAEASIKADNIVEELFVSMKGEQVEGVFTRNCVDDKLVRIQLLRKCMRVLDTSNVVDSISIDDEYSDELEIFLNGKWRMLL